MGKVIGRKRLESVISGLKKKGEKIVFTNGCYDIIHAGHVSLLKKARSMGDVLIVALNTDASVKRLKGASRPVFSGRARAAVVASLCPVDYVVFFSEDTPYNIIGTIKPDVLVKGGDYRKGEIVGADIVLKAGGEVRTVRLLQGDSTTGILKKMGAR